MTMVSDASERESRVLGQRGAPGGMADAARVERFAEIGYERGWRPTNGARGLTPVPWRWLGRQHDAIRETHLAFTRAVLAAVEEEQGDRMRALERVGRAGIAWRAAENRMDAKLDDDTMVAGEQFTAICEGFYASLAELRAAIDALAVLPPATTGGEGNGNGREG